ncbi:MAG: hypothetical protein QG672_1120 [Pseudomonadota bacterium]|nr:hypothetical protein [Pseudomonadota bacterium]
MSARFDQGTTVSVRPNGVGLGFKKRLLNVEVSGLRGFSRRSARLPGYATFWRLNLALIA